MTPEEASAHEAHEARVDWEFSYTKSPLHVILPADPGTFILWTDWPNAPHRELVIAWDINTAADGWRWPITLSGVESDTGRPVLFPDGIINETGCDGATWSSLAEFICAEMVRWIDNKNGVKVKA